MSTLRSIAGTNSGLVVEYYETLSPNQNSRLWLGKFVQPSLIVIHTAECKETPNAADNLAEWDASPNRPRASWHCAIANGIITSSVPFNRMAWHAGPVNAYSIGLEHVGRADQTVEQWNDEYSKQELILSAKLVTILCEVYEIPAHIVTVEELKANHIAHKQSFGICGHDTVTKALGGTHTDPGPNFPWDSYIKYIQSQMISL